MKFFKTILVRFFIFIKTIGEKSRKDLILALIVVKKGLAQESIETKQMLGIYYRSSFNKASKEEMKQANAQFRDLLRAMGVGFLAVMPFAPVTIPLLVKVGRKFGIEILPSSFNPENK